MMSERPYTQGCSRCGNPRPTVFVQYEDKIICSLKECDREFPPQNKNQ